MTALCRYYHNIDWSTTKKRRDRGDESDKASDRWKKPGEWRVTRSVKVCVVVIGILMVGTIAMGLELWSRIEADRRLSDEIRDLHSKVADITAQNQSKLREESTKKSYELQERCSKGATAYFTREYSRFEDTESGYIMRKYYTHYSVRLNKCFIAIDETVESYKNPQNKFTISISFVVDVNENVSYAWFSNINGTELKPKDCKVWGRTCKSKDEWDTLVATFLED